MSTVELRRLRYGHDEGAPPDLSNPRQTGRDEGVEQLAASILAHGIIQPLAVAEGDYGLLYVAEGNRRLKALHNLREAGEITDAYEVPVHVLDSSSDALEAALAANILRVPLHEADQYETFSALVAECLSEQDIASRFGIEPKRVQRILALGRLSPKILQAWRDGVFGRDEVESVRAFTLAPSVKEQDKVFDKLRKRGALSSWHIREELGVAKGDAAKHYAFIGREAYEAAGGKVTEDLFGDNHVISDPALAKKPSDEKLQRECERLVAEGWSWAALESDLPYGARWNWHQVGGSRIQYTDEETARLEELQKIISADDDDGEDEEVMEAAEAAEAERDQIRAAAEARRYSAKTKATAGCILNLDRAGRLEIKYGMQKPGAAKAEKKKADTPKEKKEPTISNALAHRLSKQLTQAAADAVKSHPDRAFEIAIAALMTNSYGSPAKLEHDGMLTQKMGKVVEFEDAYRDVMAMGADEQLNTLAGIVGQSFDFRTQSSVSPPLMDESAAMICTMLDAEMVSSLRSVFEADDYFASISRALIDAAVAEMGRPQKLKGSKAEVAATAAQYARETGWLPPELRTSHYDGPGSKAAAPAKSSRKKAKAAQPVAEVAE